MFFLIFIFFGRFPNLIKAIDIRFNLARIKSSYTIKYE